MTSGIEMERIDNEATGTFAVTTDSGTNYVLDLDHRTLLRLPNELDDWHIRRPDGQSVELLDVQRCAVGAPAVFITDPHAPGGRRTKRITTDVLSIRRLTDGAA